MLNRLERGDSGCWVIDPEEGDLYGHIVAGCPELRVGYLIPAYRIFNDISRQLGGIVTLATRTSNSNMSQRASNELIDFQFDNLQICNDQTTFLGMNLTDGEMIRQLDISGETFADMIVSFSAFSFGWH